MRPLYERAWRVFCDNRVLGRLARVSGDLTADLITGAAKQSLTISVIGPTVARLALDCKTGDEMYDAAMQAGAWAGKVSGAGGGGVLMLMTDPENRYRLISRINQAGGQASAVRLTFEGAEGWTPPA